MSYPISSLLNTHVILDQLFGVYDCDTFLLVCASATLTVTLLDVNDNAPEIIGSDTMSVSEALAVGTEVYSLTAHDEDKDQSVVFSMLTGNGTHFNVSANGESP